MRIFTVSEEIIAEHVAFLRSQVSRLKDASHVPIARDALQARADAIETAVRDAKQVGVLRPHKQ